MISGARLIHTFHGLSERKLRRVERLLLRVLVNMCDSVTFVSKALEESIESEYLIRHRNSRVTYGGTSIPSVSPRLIEQFRNDFGLEGKTIALVSGFTAIRLKSEGAKLVIDALRILHNRYPQLVLVLTRSGVFEENLKSYADMRGIRDKVIFTGTLQRSEVPVATSEIFIFPWLGGSGPGLALFEAMAQGKPIIVTNFSESHEVVVDGFNGLIAHPDSGSIAESIERLMQNPNLSMTLGMNALDTVTKRFTWDTAAETFHRLYSGD